MAARGREAPGKISQGRASRHLTPVYRSIDNCQIVWLDTAGSFRYRYHSVEVWSIYRLKIVARSRGLV